MRGPARYILRCTVFALMAALVYVVLIGVWGVVVPGKFRRNLKVPIGGFARMQMGDLQDQAPTDVLILGASHAYRGFDPRIFEQRGIGLFNLGSSAQSPLQSEVLLEQYLDGLDPRLVIFEVDPGSFSSEGVESSLELIANGKLDLSMARMAMEIHNPRTINAFIYVAQRQLLGVDKSPRDYHFTDPPSKYVYNGYVERTTGHFVAPDHPRDPVDWSARNDQMAAFGRIMDRLRSSNVQVVLVQAPTTHWSYRAILEQAEHERSMKSFAPYINMNGLVGLDDSTHFYDDNHLNQQGVEIFNAALLDSLERRGFIPFK